MRLDDSATYACDLCLEPKKPEELERVRSDVVSWRDKRPTVHADICLNCEESRPISELLQLLRVKIYAKEQEKKSREKGTGR